ncbi:MAG: InlB B-repeat-containing protein [Bacilli bacterium]|nr:InlB B-repeat-containing protein [Bacilli bacterium]
MDKKRFIVVISFIILFLIAIIVSHIYYNDKLSVSFETGTDEEILDKYVSRNSKVEEPITPTKEGYVFVEWQLDGETYDFDNLVKEDIILSAKWAKEEYVTISFNTDSMDTIESKKVLKGSILKDLETPIKEGNEFIGWYLDDKLYNNQEVNSNITLVAKYKTETINPLYLEGSKVLIVGNYSDSAYSNNAYNSIAIGWERIILYIVENSDYPYAVGDSTGVTGYFKASSIELR